MEDPYFEGMSPTPRQCKGIWELIGFKVSFWKKGALCCSQERLSVAAVIDEEIVLVTWSERSTRVISAGKLVRR